MRIIAHLDMDAFFAAIEERDKPRLKGLPIVVGSDPKDGKGRGIVSTANYKAREYGIFSAIPISKAWELSEKARKEGKPQAVFIGGRGKRYEEVSREIMEIVKRYSNKIEPASIDEAYLDFSFLNSYEEAVKQAKKLKQEIWIKERLTCSVGIGPNKLIAKIASDIQKPDGLTIIKEEEKEKFLELLPIRKIPGVGPKVESLLGNLKVKTVKDLKEMFKTKSRNLPAGTKKFLESKWGTSLYQKAKGISDSPVEEEHETKSIGEQETFPKDSLDPNYIIEIMRFLVADVIKRFEKSEFKTFKNVTITVRFQGFITKTRSYTLDKPACDLKTLEFESLKLLYPFFDRRENPQHKKIRLVGVRIEKLK
ncbi:MAG: DNA polymerase IV [bacterium]|nr:DNA polymerase IV [bacterium]